jgi:hypothetical protein
MAAVRAWVTMFAGTTEMLDGLTSYLAQPAG